MSTIPIIRPTKNQQWRERAACRRYVGRLSWFTETQDPEAARAAISICLHCPVQSECLAFALYHGEREGIWGGMSAKKRERLRAQLWRKGIVKGIRDCIQCGNPFFVETLNDPSIFCSIRCRNKARRNGNGREE